MHKSINCNPVRGCRIQPDDMSSACVSHRSAVLRSHVSSQRAYNNDVQLKGILVEAQQALRWLAP